MIGKLVSIENDPCTSIKDYIAWGLVLRGLKENECEWLKESHKHYYKVYTSKRTVVLLHREEMSEIKKQ